MVTIYPNLLFLLFVQFWGKCWMIHVADNVKFLLFGIIPIMKNIDILGGTMHL